MMLNPEDFDDEDDYYYTDGDDDYDDDEYNFLHSDDYSDYSSDDFCNFDDFFEFFPYELMRHFDPVKKNTHREITPPVELGNLCIKLRLMLQKCLENDVHLHGFCKYDVESLMKELMATMDQIKLKCMKQSKNMLASYLPFPSLVVDKIAEFLIEDENAWTLENCKFESSHGPTSGQERIMRITMNQVYNVLAGVYVQLKDLCSDMCSNRWSGDCEHTLIYNFDFTILDVTKKFANANRSPDANVEVNASKLCNAVTKFLNEDYDDKEMISMEDSDEEENQVEVKDLNINDCDVVDDVDQKVDGWNP